MTVAAERPPSAGPAWPSEEDGVWRAELDRRRRRFGKIALWIVAAVLLVVAIASAGTLVRDWWTWQAPIQSNMGRVTYDGDAPTAGFPSADDGSGALRVTYDADRTLYVELDLHSKESVEVTSVEFPANALLEPIDVQIAREDDGRGPVYTAFEPFDPSIPGPDNLFTNVRGRFSFTGCERLSPGSSTRLDSVRVTYEAKERTRHLDVPLVLPIAVTVPAEGCG